MTTATVTRPVGPPTEAEIRRTIERTFRGDRAAWGEYEHHLPLVITDAAPALTWPVSEARSRDAGEGLFQPGEDGGNDLWYDLTAAQADRLEALVNEAAKRAAALCEAVIADEMAAAGVQFAAEYPDASRGIGLD